VKLTRSALACSLIVCTVLFMTVACTATSPQVPTGPEFIVHPAPPNSSLPRREPTDVRLTILHTNDSRGYVDPCG